MGKLCFGVDLGGTTVKMGLFTVEGALLEDWEIPTNKEDNGAHILDDIAASIKAKIENDSINEADVVGVGIGVPGPVTPNGIVKGCVNLGWGDTPVEESLKDKTGFNVKAGNDANVAALGELWQGGGKGFNSLVMVTLGTGVGGGIILDGKILAGVNGAGGEIGHIKINSEETDVCGCGKTGCLEQYASATGIVKAAKKALNTTDRPSRLREVQYISAKEVFDAAKAGDDLADELVNELGYNLGLALSHIACVVDPEAFVIGGGVSKAGEILINTIKKYYEENAFHACRGAKFELATLGNDAGIYGAAALILK